MKVRCVRILEGGRAGGDVLKTKDSAIHVGGEFVVISLSGSQSAGIKYMLLDEATPTETVVWTAEMFEITNPAVSPTWRAVDPYGSGKLITLEPEAWCIDRFWERKEALDPEALAAFLHGITHLYEEEQEPVPAEVTEWLDRLQRGAD